MRIPDPIILFCFNSSRLFTVLCFSVRSSRSSALRYGLPSCMSVKTTWGGRDGLGGSSPSSYNPRRPPPRYIWKINGNTRYTSMISRKNRGLWTIYTSSNLGRVPNRFFGIRDFPYLKAGIRDFKAKWGRDSRVESIHGITGLTENLGCHDGIEEPFWESSIYPWVLPRLLSETLSSAFLTSRRG